jgi:hypothetical protein
LRARPGAARENGAAPDPAGALRRGRLLGFLPYAMILRLRSW